MILEINSNWEGSFIFDLDLRGIKMLAMLIAQQKFVYNLF